MIYLPLVASTLHTPVLPKNMPKKHSIDSVLVEMHFHSDCEATVTEYQILFTLGITSYFKMMLTTQAFCVGLHEIILKRHIDHDLLWGN